MNIKVIYSSRTGNTKKIADAIAENLGVSAETVSEYTPFESVDLLFLGDGIYGGKPNPKTDSLIKSLSDEKVKNVAVFGTYGGQPKAIISMQESLKKQGIKVLDESYGCRGKSWWILNRKHPNSQDIDGAKEFAKKAVSKI